MTLRTGGAPWILIGALLLGVPAGILVGLLFAREQLDGLSQAPAALVEPVRVSDLDERTGVAATLTWVDGPRLYAPVWSGIVGRVDLMTGQRTSNGDPIAVIDGITRLAVASPEPFHRALALDDRGPDVGWLHDALAAFGYLEQVPDNNVQVSDSTIRAIRALATHLGVVDAPNAFDPGWFVWLPEDPFEATSVELTAGAPAPPIGSAIAIGPAQLGAAALQRTDGAQLTLEPDVSYVLEIAGEELPLLSEAAHLDDAGLARLSAALPAGLESASGSIRRAAPLTVWSVPSSAVMSGFGGQLCIWIDNGGQYEPVNVDVVAGRAGVTFVRPPRAAAHVLQNPAQILPQPACP